MSHITSVEGSVIIQHKDLPQLAQAIKAFCPDLELVPNQTHYRTWKDNHGGRLVGDYPVPEGWTEASVGENAAHIIRVTDKYLAKHNQHRNDGSAPYEIGIVPVKVERDAKGNVLKALPDKNGKEYILTTDWWNQGQGILKCEGVGHHHTAKHPQTGQNVEMSFGQLYMHFRMMQAKHEAELNGDEMTFEKQKDGSYVGTVNTDNRIKLTN